VSLKNGKASVGNRIDDGIVTASVKSALIADDEIKGLEIGVATYRGVVQLSGFVDSLDQANHAVLIVSATDGVQGVNNEMTVKK
jgi:hyperosmotically inducible periplasmic protein